MSLRSVLVKLPGWNFPYTNLRTQFQTSETEGHLMQNMFLWCLWSIWLRCTGTVDDLVILHFLSVYFLILYCLLLFPQPGSPLVPGRCWPFDGDRGHLHIQLSDSITISHVTLGHIGKTQSITGYISSAPRGFSVYVSHFAALNQDIPHILWHSVNYIWFCLSFRAWKLWVVRRSF